MKLMPLYVPLITKADGGKFGKTESGNVWLDANYTSPYAFYQFWMNVSDDDAKKYIKIFTMLTREEIEQAIEQHEKEPHLRILQKMLAKEVTTMVHGEQEYRKAVEASGILFGNATSDALKKLDERTFLSVFEGVPQFELPKEKLGTDILNLLAVDSKVFPSKGECRKMIQANGLSINKEKYTDIQRRSLCRLSDKRQIYSGPEGKEELLYTEIHLKTGGLMEGESTRQQKIARQLQRDLAEIIRSKGMAAYNGAMVTVSEVRVTPDLSQAKVYVSIFPSSKAEQVMEIIRNSVKQLRGELGRLVAKQLRIVPELLFFLDISLDYAEHIDELLKK